MSGKIPSLAVRVGGARACKLWRNTTTGDIAIWFMNGTSLASGQSVGNVTTDWTIQGLNSD